MKNVLFAGSLGLFLALFGVAGCGAAGDITEVHLPNGAICQKDVDGTFLSCDASTNTRSADQAESARPATQARKAFECTTGPGPKICMCGDGGSCRKENGVYYCGCS